MPKLFMIKAGLFGICCIVLLTVAMGKAAVVSEPEEPVARQIQYSFTIQNKTNRVLKNAQFWAYAPVKQTASQFCAKIETSHPYELIGDKLNNQILKFTFQDFPPYATKVVTIKAWLKFSNIPNEMPLDKLDVYLQPEKYIESDNPEILHLAGKLKSSAAIKTAENIFNWVAANIKYSGYLKNDRGALYALRSKQGDCTEFAYLFVALCRANNIPARGIGGYVSWTDKIIKPQSYHNWAEFYDNGAWKIVDPLEKVFAQNRADYIALQIIGNSPENPWPQFNRYQVNENELNVTVNEVIISIN